MSEVMAGLQFSIGCLALGLGLFLVAGAVQGVLRARLLPAFAARTAVALGGTMLLAGGGYVARLALPL